MLKPIIIIVSVAALAVIVNRIPFVDSNDYNYGPITVGPSVTAVSRQTEPLCIAAVFVDYKDVTPVFRGIPFTITETLDDECGTFYNNPNYYIKIFPVGIMLNSIIFVGLGFGLYKIVTMRKGKEK